MSLKKLKVNLRQLRIRQGLTVTEVAKKLGYSRQSVYNWEKGYAFPSMELIEKFEEVYGSDFVEAVKQTVKEQQDGKYWKGI